MFCLKHRQTLEQKEHYTLWQWRRVLRVGLLSGLAWVRRMLMVMSMMRVALMVQRVGRWCHVSKMMDTMRA